MPASPFHRLVHELKRRRVFRAAGAYLVMAWVAIEVAGTVVPIMGLPAWVSRLVLFLLILGFPIAVGLAWAVDLTDGGVRRTEAGAGAAPDPGGHDGVTRIAAAVLVGIGVLAAALAGGWYLVGGVAGRAVADHSIAVLPFETLGAAETSAFTEGVHSGILTRLSSVADLDVISRTSVLGYRSTTAPLRKIAAELGVAWVVRGEVQELGDRVQVNARLVDARADRQVWAEAWEEELTAGNVFQIQSQVATAIIGELQARLTAGEEQRLERQPTGSIEAYRLYVQGRSHLETRTAPAMRRSLNYFHRAIAADSGYALPWVGLADALILLHDYGYESADSTLPAAEAAVDRALKLDPGSAEGHASLGLLYGTRHQSEASIRALERAVELRPSYAEAHNWLAWGHLVMGQEEAALERAARAVALSPLAPETVGNLAWSYLALGRPADALAEGRRMQELEPAFPDGRLVEGVSLYEMGRAAEAKPVVRDLVVPWAGSGPELTLALAHIATGDLARARSLQAELGAASDAFAVAVIHAALGDKEAAFAAFDRVDSWGEYWPTLASRHFYREALASVRADPRFDRILRQLDRTRNEDP